MTKPKMKAKPKPQKGKIDNEITDEPNEVDPEKKHLSNYISNIPEALFLITLGTVFLLNTTGIISWGIWTYLWRFWPLFIVFAGINLMVGSSKFFKLISGIISLVIFILSIFISIVATDAITVGNFSFSSSNFWKDFSTALQVNPGNKIEKEYLIAQNDYTAITSRDINVKIGTGKFVITDEDSTDYFQVNSTYFEHFGEPNIVSNNQNENLNIDFEQTNNNRLFTIPSDTTDYSFKIGTQSLESILYVNLGAGEGSINLTELNLKNLEAEVGAGKLNISLGEKVLPDNLNFDVGAGSIILSISDNIGYKLNYSIGVGSLEIGNKEIGKIGTDNAVYESSNYSSAEKTIEINVNVGVGEFKINQE